jgi:hypothetical protein
MRALLFFLGISFFLALEGRLLLQLLRWPVAASASRHSPLLAWLFGFPLGVFLHALLTFLCTIVAFPITLPILALLHAGLLILLSLLARRSLSPPASSPAPAPASLLKHLPPIPRKILVVLLLLSLTVKGFYGLSHALLLPTFYYDSLSQWNLRSRISYEDRAIAFDQDERRGMSKPQYPILLHALQIFPMLLEGRWVDRIANASIFLFCVTSFLALALFLGGVGGSALALLSGSLLLMVPLNAFHLGQAYADLPLLLTVLLSALLLAEFAQHHHISSLVVSALLAATSAWVKLEGLYFGVLPWLLLLALLSFLRKGQARPNDPVRIGRRRGGVLLAASPILLGFLWVLFLLLRGLPLSAHPGDFLLSWHSDAIGAILLRLFTYGSFGIVPFLLLTLLVPLLFIVRRTWAHVLPELLIVAWGILTTIETFLLYLLTPTVQFLLNDQTFHRTMLLPLSLLLLGTLLLLQGVLRRRAGTSV